ncbi:ATP-binding protein [Mesobacillus maritimus]|uniref:ATP-binding protein n=1 Tax=Mesobacillus maritimus TaxID=1643336 RepID=UPI00203DE212|nr:ATP-binding protein [Mesobacillus maritimus]MCM3585503.1 ATP-binding protein [Mesobacillus maritimus]
MNVSTREEVLKIEEVKALKLFIFLFYFVFIGFDSFYYFIYPYFSSGQVGLPEKGLGILMYILLVMLLPIALVMIKKGNPFFIKYLFFITFILIEFINNILIYWDNDEVFSSGNLVEIVFVLFAPIFVNKRFYWVVCITIFVKYVAYGVLFNSMSVIIPVVLISFFAIFGYILLSRFISYINGMICAYEHSKQKEKLAAVGQIATSIAHEIKNPLSSLKGFTQLQFEKDKSEESFYPIMLNEIDRINLIVSDLLVLGKPNGSVKTSVSIAEMINYVVSIIEPQASRQLIKIQTEMKEPLPNIYCDENQFKQVLLNLLKNSVESMPDGGTISVNAQFEDNHFVISVEDEGEGIPEEQIVKLGEPFYTTKPNGTGLGLMVTKKIIEEHDGKLEIVSSPNKGTKIDIILPKQ